MIKAILFAVLYMGTMLYLTYQALTVGKDRYGDKMKSWSVTGSILMWIGLLFVIAGYFDGDFNH